MDISNKIKDAREALGWSRENLARRINVTGHSIYLWETGRSQPLRKHVFALAEVLQLPISDLLVGERPKSSTGSVEELLEQLKRALGMRHGVSSDQIRIDVTVSV